MRLAFSQVSEELSRLPLWMWRAILNVSGTFERLAEKIEREKDLEGLLSQLSLALAPILMLLLMIFMPTSSGFQCQLDTLLIPCEY